MVGLINDEKHITTQWFKDEGDVIILVGRSMGFQPTDRQPPSPGGYGVPRDADATTLGGSQYLKVCHGLKLVRPRMSILRTKSKCKTPCAI